LFLQNISEEAGNLNRSQKPALGIEDTYGDVSETTNPTVFDTHYMCTYRYTARQTACSEKGGYFLILLQPN